ncbi:hypothetical protein [Winogradskyella sp. UBA3174]|uniref:hypothetical protein n=1 Tax=Winogradskyella sp. UBA3174 TaxID=1947785 RepID=UPI0025D1D3CC|nr:hypothetical protein [Winogradskyella sp. UBA3174]|tara:strand:+ start:5478 stop:6518 length:1041 start_codon:yes stop_codon:yes gene_type:complete
MNILVVDDDTKQNKILKDSIELFNKTSNVQITLDEAITLDDGLKKLRKNSYDGAIVDMRLEPNDTDGLGNQILNEIKSKLRFPVRVVSGHLGDLEPELQSENYLFRCTTRGDEDYDVILSEFQDIHSTGITGILNNKGLIETNINNIFWRHISEILPEFVNHKKANPDWEVEKVLLRYISSHILEYLEISIDNNLEPVHNIEFYIKPPVKEKVFTGDILKVVGTNDYGIILTPACDLATDSKRTEPKAEYVTICIIDKYTTITMGKNSGDTRNLKSNKADLKFHFLPETILFEGGFINFQRILSVPINDIANKSKFEVECVITNPFRKDIISRFGNYFSRQGQPSF